MVVVGQEFREIAFQELRQDMPKQVFDGLCVLFLWVFEHGPLLNTVHAWCGHDVAYDKSVSCLSSAPKSDRRKISISQAFIQSIKQSENPSANHQSFNQSLLLLYIYNI